MASAAGNVFDSGFPGEVSLWEPKNGDCLNTVPIPGGAWSAAYAPDGRTLAVGSGAQNVTIFDNSLRFRCSLEQGAAVRRVAFAPDGKTLAAAAGWEIKVWEVSTQKTRHTLRGHRGFVWAVAFSPDGRTLFSGSEDQTVRVWDVRSGMEKSAFEWKIGKVRSLAVSPDGMTVAAGGDNNVVVWDTDNG